MQQTKRRMPWLAALLSLLQPGLGHLYAGDLRRAVLLAIAFWLVGLLAAYGMLLPGPRPFNIVVPVAIILFAYLAIAGDAFIRARRKDVVALRRFQRWYVYGFVLVLFAFVIQPVMVGLLKQHVARSYVATSLAMEPTVLEGDWFLAAPLDASRVKRGMIVLFASPGDLRILIQSRITGLPLDTLEMRNARLYVNGTAESIARQVNSPDGFHETMLWQANHVARSSGDAYRPTRDNWGPLVLPEGKLACRDLLDQVIVGERQSNLPGAARAMRHCGIACFSASQSPNSCGENCAVAHLIRRRPAKSPTTCDPPRDWDLDHAPEA